MPTPEELMTAIERVEGHYQHLNDELGPQLTRELEQIREHGGVVRETRQQIDSLTTQWESMQTEHNEMIAEMRNVLGNAGAPGTGGAESIETHADTFIQSDAFQSRGSRLTIEPVDVPSFHRRGAELEQRWLTSAPSGVGGAGSLVQPVRRPELITDPRRTFVMRDLLNVVPVQSGQIEIIRQRNFFNFIVVLTANITAGTDVMTVENISGMFVGQRVTVGQGTGTPETRTVLAINAVNRVVTVNTAFASGHTAGEFVVSDQLGGTEHGALKPQANIEFEVESVGLTTLAHWIPAHRQTLDDIGLLRNMIDTELRYGLEMTEEDQLLFGPGTGGNIRGIMNNQFIQDQGTKPAASGTPATPTQLDWLRQAIGKAYLAQYPPNGVILNPADDQDIELLKDTTGQYLYLNLGGQGNPVVWQVPKVISVSMPAGSFLLGAFGLAAELYDREQSNIRVAEQHADFFVRNAVAILAEERIGLGVKRPEAFVKGKFA